MIHILTCCKHGLVRSVGLADVLKLHFKPVDVIPVGLSSNSATTLEMLYQWADWIIVMEERYGKRIPEGYGSKVLVCEVGQDIYGSSHHGSLIDQCWRWCRKNNQILGIEEHYDAI